MFRIFQALAQRVRAMFVTDAALEFEAELLSRNAERKAELLRRAQRYADEGLHGIAEHLREQAEQVQLTSPLASVLPAIEHLKVEDHQVIDMPLLPAPQPPSGPQNQQPKQRRKRKAG